MTANIDEYIKASASEYKDLFEKHEQYFKEITQKADENFKKLSEAIKNAQNDILTCRERNKEIRQQISDLDEQINKERESWKQRLTEIDPKTE